MPGSNTRATASEKTELFDAVGVGAAMLADLYALKSAFTTACPALIRRLPMLPAVIRGVRGLPRETLTVSSNASGTSIVASFSGRRQHLPRHLAVAVLRLPTEPADYMRGRKRQAVRTNCTRARSHGLAYGRGESATEIETIIESVTATHPRDLVRRAALLARLQSRDNHWRYVADASGNPLALGQFTADRGVVRLNWGVTADHPLASEARHLLAAELFQEIAADGYSIVVTESALFVRPGVHYFLRRLGFEWRNLAFRVESDDLSAEEEIRAQDHTLSSRRLRAERDSVAAARRGARRSPNQRVNRMDLRRLGGARRRQSPGDVQDTLH